MIPGIAGIDVVDSLFRYMEHIGNCLLGKYAKLQSALDEPYLAFFQLGVSSVHGFLPPMLSGHIPMVNGMLAIGDETNESHYNYAGYRSPKVIFSSWYQ